MSRNDKGADVGFIPHYDCTVSSGDCFRFSMCLRDCRKGSRKRLVDRIDALEERMDKIEKELAKG